MKIGKALGKILGGVFALAGIAIVAGAVALALRSLDAPVRLAETPQEALDCAQAMMEAVETGDYAAAGEYIYGQPDLGADREPENEMGRQIWQAYLDSIQWEFTGDCYATDGGIAQDVQVTTLDISSATDGLKDRVQAGLNEKVAQAENMEQLYDESGAFREDLVLEVLHQAVAEALKENRMTQTRQATVNLIFREGRWWVAADQNLLQAISGGMAG